MSGLTGAERLRDTLGSVENPRFNLALATIQSVLYAEQLESRVSLLDVDWNCTDWRWYRNVPDGPNDPTGIAAIAEAREQFGPANVTTGNAANPECGHPTSDPYPRQYAPHQVGVYVREAVS